MNYTDVGRGAADVVMSGAAGTTMREVGVLRQNQDASDQDLEQLTALFRLLSDKTRLNILLMLADGERNVSSLCEELQLPQPTVSHHLGLLRMNHVIGNRRAGKQVFYGLNGRVDTDASSLQIDVQHFDVRIVHKVLVEQAAAS